MRNQRSFRLESKRRAIEEMMSGASGPAQLYRLYDVTASLLYRWKRQYSRGKFDNGPSEEAAVRDRVEKLERLVGELTLENEVLKRGLAAQPQPTPEKRQAIRVWRCLGVGIRWGCR